jgi:hypothetical protein
MNLRYNIYEKFTAYESDMQQETLRTQHSYEVISCLGSEVFMAVSMKMAVFWVVAPCSLVKVYQTTRRYNPEDSHLISYCSELRIVCFS